jgi:uncharacterized protein (TIGR03067 family)
MRRSYLPIVVFSLTLTACSKEPERTPQAGTGPGPAVAREAGDAKPQDPKEVEKELNRLQGVWDFVETEWEGKRTKEGPGKTRTFKGDEMIDETEGAAKLTRRGTVTIDPTRSPKTLDFLVSGAKGPPVKYAYELKGDTLTFCARLGVNDYPKQITGKGEGQFMEVYKRKK